MSIAKTRTRISVVSGTIATVLVIASAAYACTVYKGTMTFTFSPVASGSPSSQTVIGKNNGMNWCGGLVWPPPVSTNDLTLETVTITSGAASTCLNANGTNFLTDGTYRVSVARGWMGQGGQPHVNCHDLSEAAPPPVGNTDPGPVAAGIIGLYEVDDGNGGYSGGAQSFQYLSGLDPSAPYDPAGITFPGYNNICVFKQGDLPTDPISSDADANSINIGVV